MMGEVSKSEVKPQMSDNFKSIKPEKEMTMKELNDGVKEKFDKAQKEYFDDNDVEYRKGDSLLPNISFERNGYRYKTDDLGRIASAEGKLRLKEGEKRKTINETKEAIGKGEMKETDERGHLIADRFEGSGGLENLVPMDTNLNRSDYSKMENDLAKALQGGKDVRLKIQPVYEGDSRRPSEIRAIYSIDGELDVRIFKNESRDKL